MANTELKLMPQQYLSLLPERTSDGLEIYLKRDWRSYFTSKLSGRGLEIGPLHRPMNKHAGMQVEYIDRYSVADLRAHYPELKELALVEADILGDAQDLSTIKNSTYDFLISAHVIEHMKDPLRALENWCRVVKPGGLVYLIAPDKRAIFDHQRSRTALSHIILDYLQPSAQRDFEHYFDYARHVHGKEEKEAIAEANRLIETDYSIHYHVFVPGDMKALLIWFSENIRKIEILEGPTMSPQVDKNFDPKNFCKEESDFRANNPEYAIYPESDEFHFLIRVL